MAAWRIRRCPSCRSTFPAGQLAVVNYGAHWNEHGRALRSCPRCGHRGLTGAFAVVADKRHPAVTTSGRPA